jgi:hypothetical protein
MRPIIARSFIVGILGGIFFFFGSELAVETYPGFDAFLVGALIVGGVAATAIPRSMPGGEPSRLMTALSIAMVLVTEVDVVASLITLFPSLDIMPMADPQWAIFGAVWSLVIILPMVLVVRRMRAENRLRDRSS